MFPASSHHSPPRGCSSATWPEIYRLRPSTAGGPEQLAEPVMCMSAIRSSFIARRGRTSVPDRAWSPNPRSRITSRLRYATAPPCARSNGQSFAVSGSCVYRPAGGSVELYRTTRSPARPRVSLDVVWIPLRRGTGAQAWLSRYTPSAIIRPHTTTTVVMGSPRTSQARRAARTGVRYE